VTAVVARAATTAGPDHARTRLGSRIAPEVEVLPDQRAARPRGCAPV